MVVVLIALASKSSRSVEIDDAMIEKLAELNTLEELEAFLANGQLQQHTATQRNNNNARTPRRQDTEEITEDSEEGSTVEADGSDVDDEFIGEELTAGDDTIQRGSASDYNEDISGRDDDDGDITPTDGDATSSDLDETDSDLSAAALHQRRVCGLPSSFIHRLIHWLID
jgi:hypothetical protein